MMVDVCQCWFTGRTMEEVEPASVISVCSVLKSGAAAVFQGNVVLWKPSDAAMSASYAVYRILRECGLPPNIIQFLPADGPVFGDTITASEHLAGINFTGSVP